MDRARRGRGLAASAVAALLLHAAFLSGLEWSWPGAMAPKPALRVRIVEAAAHASVVADARA
ncbi:MAG: hypothetical protein M3Y67_08935, partial [Pseudomonadota bacterium]|nr:hypothetical protein [Pseudomonadota bacterium]